MSFHSMANLAKHLRIEHPATTADRPVHTQDDKQTDCLYTVHSYTSSNEAKAETVVTAQSSSVTYVTVAAMSSSSSGTLLRQRAS
jgi:hypothetical protein